jgi:hypothetical protein
MKINEIFVKDLSRKINGVVKAEQRDPAVIWQELDEFVVTRELSKHIDSFFQTYIEFLDRPNDLEASNRNGVWISGFFGSGKSHFLKILSYLLENIDAQDPVSGARKRAVEFLKGKISDPLLFNNIRKAVSSSCDVILFNIDSKADVHEDSQAQLLSVFTKVFNEHQGYCGQYPYVAELESQLQKESLLELYIEHFRSVSSFDWLESRDNFHFVRDDVIESLKLTKSMSHESASIWFDGCEQNYSNSPEAFAKKIKQYLDFQPPNHRIIFLVDEMGQFIGSDGQRMLKLQTIAEDLGIHCGGRAWVVVTSQEDIDATIGDMKSRLKQDFSKIQGRFKCRLSLSSANTDEVIQFRLLDKTPPAKINLGNLFDEKRDILKHQLSFTSDCATLKNFKDTDDFIKNYPFVPFQYQLVQKVFETIRTSGVSGAHLSKGERSMLDSFQIAAQKISDKDVGAMVPIYSFYSAIEGFLDTTIKRTIDQAVDNTSLKPFDIDVLKTLFLIRRIDNLVKPNIENLVTLSITEVDSDKLGLKKVIGESLNRLEKETLINRSGDHYYFLTNEERDIGTQIKNTDVSMSEEVKLLSELIYEEAIKAGAKHRYSVNKKDYSYNKLLDGIPHGFKVDNELTVEIVSPLSEDSNGDDVYYLNRSTTDKGKIIFRLPDNQDLLKELKTYKQTHKFITMKSDSSGAPSFMRILEDRAAENKSRRTRIVQLLSESFLNSDCFVCGNSLELKSSNPGDCLTAALDYLISNVYSKLGYIKKSHDDPVKEIKYLLTSDSPTQETLIANLDKDNPDAINEIQTYIRYAVMKNQHIELTDIIKYFSSRPFGWPEWETIILVTRLFVAREIKLISGEALGLKDAYGPLTKTPQWKLISIQKMRVPGKEDLEKAKKIAQTIFGSIGPDDSEGLSRFIQEKLEVWRSTLANYKIIVDNGTYPGKKEIDDGLTVLNNLVQIVDPFEFFSSFNSSENELTYLEEDFRELTDFYENHRTLWNNLISKVAVYKQIQNELEAQFAPEHPVKSLTEILNSPRPYDKLKTVESLIEQVDAVYLKILDSKKLEATNKIGGFIEETKTHLNSIKAPDNLCNQALRPIQEIKKLLESETSVPQVAYHLQQADVAYGQALDLIVEPSVVTGEPIRKIESIKLSTLMKSEVIETEQQVNDFVDKLRQTLLEKINQAIKVRIS